MKIGDNFYHQIERFLVEIARQSKKTESKKIAVEDVNRELNYSREDIKEILGYLEDKGYVIPETIGGKWLYGHVSITNKGKKKVESLD